jgi:S-adenosylmethionine-diacylglycerol 3-amino-3-carboxypropyl transferase
MLEALKQLPSASCDFLHLSNILDWLSPKEALLTLNQATRVLRGGGLVAVRQLNSTLPIRQLGSSLRWMDSLSHALLEADRSFFYREFHVGVRP